MGAAQVPVGKGGILRGRRGDGTQRGPAEPEEKRLHAADVQGGELPDPQLLPHDPQVEQGLLHEGGLPALGRGVEDDVLMLADQVAEDGAVAFPADEILPGDEFVVNEWSVHNGL